MSPSASRKSRLAPLSSSTTMNDAYRFGAGRPRISARNAADRLLSRAETIVWLKCTAMASSACRGIPVATYGAPDRRWPARGSASRRVQHSEEESGGARFRVIERERHHAHDHRGDGGAARSIDEAEHAEHERETAEHAPLEGQHQHEAHVAPPWRCGRLTGKADAARLDHVEAQRQRRP